MLLSIKGQHQSVQESPWICSSHLTLKCILDDWIGDQIVLDLMKVRFKCMQDTLNRMYGLWSEQLNRLQRWWEMHCNHIEHKCKCNCVFNTHTFCMSNLLLGAKWSLWPFPPAQVCVSSDHSWVKSSCIIHHSLPLPSSPFQLWKIASSPGLKSNQKSIQ